MASGGVTSTQPLIGWISDRTSPLMPMMNSEVPAVRNVEGHPGQTRRPVEGPPLAHRPDAAH